METLEDIKWVDTHCHLQLMGDEINEEDISNLEYFIIPGVDVPSSLKAKEFSLTYPEKSYWSAGLHPHEADSLEDIKNELQLLMEEADLIGETGLDYYRNLSSKENQLKNFEFHLDVSKELNKPLIIHCRDSFSDVFDTLSTRETTNPIILHSWTGGRKWTKRFRELDVYFSISGIVTYETAKDLQLSVKEIPMNRLLLETDTPYLTPVPLKGKDNRPNFIAHTASKISNLLEIDEKKLSEITIKNSRELLKR